MSLNLILLLINNSFSLPELSPIAKRQFYLQKAWQPKHAHKETTCVIFPKVLNTSNNYSEKGDWYRSNQSNGTFTIYLFFNQHCWSLICVGPCKNLEVATNGSLKYVTKLYSTTPEHVDRTYFGSEYMSVQMVICPKKTIQIISIHQPKQRNKNNSHSNKKKHEFIQKPPRFSSINPAPFTVNTAIGESLHFLFVIFRFQVADEGAESPSAAVNSWPTWKAPSNASEGGKSGFQVVIITGRGSNPCQVIGLEHFTKANKKLQKQK